MQIEERLKALLSATPKQLAAIDAALSGRCLEAERYTSLRLLRVGEFAQRSGISRYGVWRMCKENRLRTVELRKGSRRIPESELIRLVEGG